MVVVVITRFRKMVMMTVNFGEAKREAEVPRLYCYIL